MNSIDEQIRAPDAAKPTNKSATIMVVDDVPTNLELVEQILHQKGYDVICFSEGSLAIAAAKRKHPDLFLLDINMPEMTGFELCQHLKADSNLAQIPIIFVTAYQQPTEKLRAFQLGAVDYVTKPFHPEEVIARVQTHLRLIQYQKDVEGQLVELEQLEKWRDLLVHMIVHDLRSPTHAMGLEADVLKRFHKLPSEVMEGLSNIITSSQKMEEMLKDILNVSKMTNQRVAIAYSRHNVKQLIEETRKRFIPLTPQTPLEVSIAPHITTVECDHSLISRVLTNLVDNAISHSPSEEPVKITVSESNGHLRFEVIDHGPGIRAANHSQLFENFGQLHLRNEPGRKGTGLGLAFCKLAVEAHHGKIGIISAEGAGTTFWFTLPAD